MRADASIAKRLLSGAIDRFATICRIGKLRTEKIMICWTHLRLPDRYIMQSPSAIFPVRLEILALSADEGDIFRLSACFGESCIDLDSCVKLQDAQQKAVDYLIQVSDDINLLINCWR